MREQILQILEPIASNMGLDLEDVEIKSAGKHSIVQVSIDKDGGINFGLFFHSSSVLLSSSTWK